MTGVTPYQLLKPEPGNPNTLIGFDGSGDPVLVSGSGSADLIHVQHQLPLNTNGGAAGGSGVFFTRPLNTVVENNIVGASLAANEITLPAGIYRARFDTQSQSTSDKNKHRLYDVTGAATLFEGLSFGSGTASTHMAYGVGTFTLAGVSNVRLEMITNNISNESTELGLAANFGLAEIYTDLQIWKVG